MGTLLKQTLELYTESWKEPHDKVMKLYENADRLSEAVSWGIFLFDELYNTLLQDGTASVEGVECAHRGFDEWYSVASHVIAAIDKSMSEGFGVARSEELQRRYSQAGPIIEELLDAMRAIESVNNGTAVSVTQFLDELRSQVH
jgi:hypothetical protein